MPLDLPRSFGRLIALDVRPQKIGFVVFDDATRIIDWGVRGTIVAWRKGEKNPLSRLLGLYAPSLVVIRRSQRSPEAAHRVAPALAMLRAEAKSRMVELRIVQARTINRFFATLGCTTKHQIASLLGERFDEIAWKVPPKRKLWEPEDYRSCIFDAAATGVYVFAAGQ